ncbi:MAG: hypothetical protein ACKOVB_00740 [Terrabacter sp.]
MSEQPTTDSSPTVPGTPPAAATPAHATPAHATPTDGTPAGAPPAGATPPPATPAQPSKRAALLKRFGGAFLAILAVFAFRAFTADDGTHGIKAGECVAAVGSDDFKKVDCADSTSLGKVTFIQTDSATDESSALSLCEKHDAQGAFTSSTSDGGKGTVVCVAETK